MNELKERVLQVEGGSVEGTIIDFETVGVLQDWYKDTRRYEKVRPYLLGFLNGNRIVQKYVEKSERIHLLADFMKNLGVSDLFASPNFAFNTEFETGVFYCAAGRRFLFDGELQRVKYEKKEAVVSSFGLKTYDDPFNGSGYECLKAFEGGNVDDCLKHNQACLLKERDILHRRGFFPTPDVLFHDIRF